MKLAFSFLALLLSSQVHAAVGFQNGNHIEITPVDGWATVRCNRGPYVYQETYHCSGADIQPDAYDHFITDSGVKASKVFLSASHANGSVTNKDSKWDQEKARSKSAFNLVINTLTQNPLLNWGVNRVDYIMKDGDETVETGTFEATVVEMPARFCPNRYLGFTYQCGDTARICNDYFYFSSCKR